MPNHLNRFFPALLAISAFLASQNSAQAHYDFDALEGKKVPHKHSGKNGHKHSNKKAHGKSSSKHQHGNSTAQVKTFDPWKLLEMAISPAYAFQTQVAITMQGPYRVVRSNGIPDHSTGEFPNQGNPNTIAEQEYLYRMPKEPKRAEQTTPLSMNVFGVAINGVPFDPGAAEWWNRNPMSGWQYEAMALGPRLGLDRNNAHVQPNGAYHYHGPPTGLLERLKRVGKPVLIGYAADGFPIYGPYGYKDANDAKSGMKKLSSSYRIRGGTRPNGPGGTYDGTFVQDYEYVSKRGDLDNCNGRTGVTPEFPAGTYYYVVTDNYPYIPRGWKGTPDDSFVKRGPGGQRGGARTRPDGGRNSGNWNERGYGPPGDGQGFGPPGGGQGFGPPGGEGFGPPGRGGFGPPPGRGQGSGRNGPPGGGFGPPGGGPPGGGGFGPPGNQRNGNQSRNGTNPNAPPGGWADGGPEFTPPEKSGDAPGIGFGPGGGGPGGGGPGMGPPGGGMGPGFGPPGGPGSGPPGGEQNGRGKVLWDGQ